MPWIGLITNGVFEADSVVRGDVEEIRSGDTLGAPCAAESCCRALMVLKAVGIVACCWGVRVAFMLLEVFIYCC